MNDVSSTKFGALWSSSPVFPMAWFVCLIWGLAGGCAQNVKRIDLHDQTIPADARNLVADAEDSIAIARARIDETERDVRETKKWREALLERDWPAGASSLVQRLRRLTDGRVKLAELRLERARANVEYTRAKFDLITAKTAIRNDLAVYRLDPIRTRVDREKSEVDELDGEITSQRKKIAQLENSWWDSYKSYAKEGGETGVLYVSSAGKLPAPNLRASDREEESDEGEGDQTDGESGETAPKDGE